MKIAVYGVAKNEENNVQGWYESIKEADYILILDTGSTDKTIEAAESLGIEIKTAIFDPWDETVAKNVALSQIPLDYDYCINLDLDQRIDASNWKSLLKGIGPGYDIISCNNISSTGYASLSSEINRIHKRSSMSWIGYRPMIKTISGESKKKYIDIDIINVSGNSMRYASREPMYIDSFVNYLNLIQYYRYPDILLYCLLNISLSYFEIEDLNNFNFYYDFYIKQYELEPAKSVYVKGVEFSAMLAKSLISPENTFTIYNDILSSNNFSDYQKFFVKLKKCIIFYFQDKHEALEDELSKINIDNKYIIDHRTKFKHIISDEELKIYNYLCNFVYLKLNKDLKNENEMINFFSSINYGKLHKEMSKSALNVLRSLNV